MLEYSSTAEQVHATFAAHFVYRPNDSMGDRCDDGDHFNHLLLA